MLDTGIDIQNSVIFLMKNNYNFVRYFLLLSFQLHLESLFVCVEVLRPSQPNRVMSSAVSLPNHTFTGQA